MATDKKITYKDQRLTKDQQKKIKPVTQAGTKNFLGKQEMVTVPKRWLSSPDHVVAELAYITPREQKILIDKNLYGSLKGKPNVGPGGIMSLQGGDFGAGEVGGGSANNGDKGGSDFGQFNRAISRAKNNPTTTGTKGDDKGESFFDKAVNFYNKLPTPLNLAKSIAQKFGPINNLDFYNQKVVPAGKTDLGFEDYMAARMAGTIDAYGNPIDKTGGGGGRSNISNTGILQVQEITPVGENNEQINVANTPYQNDMLFNFGTFSKPVYKKDLV
jgi:hypothetical protein